MVGLVDSGAEVSCIYTDLANLVNQVGNRKPIATASGPIIAEVMTGVTVALRNFILKIDLVALPLGAVQMIIGMDILSAVGAIIACNPPRLAMAGKQTEVMYMSEFPLRGKMSSELSLNWPGPRGFS